VLVGLPQGVDGLAVCFIFILFQFHLHITHQVLVELPY
jgi:hypothetical protein